MICLIRWQKNVLRLVVLLEFIGEKHCLDRHSEFFFLWQSHKNKMSFIRVLDFQVQKLDRKLRKPNKDKKNYLRFWNELEDIKNKQQALKKECPEASAGSKMEIKLTEEELQCQRQEMESMGFKTKFLEEFKKNRSSCYAACMPCD